MHRARSTGVAHIVMRMWSDRSGDRTCEPGRRGNGNDTGKGEVLIGAGARGKGQAGGSRWNNNNVWVSRKGMSHTGRRAKEENVQRPGQW